MNYKLHWHGQAEDRADGLKYRVLRSKLNRLVYVIIKDVIYIVAVFDNRQNPSNMENILKERE